MIFKKDLLKRIEALEFESCCQENSRKVIARELKDVREYLGINYTIEFIDIPTQKVAKVVLKKIKDETKKRHIHKA